MPLNTNPQTGKQKLKDRLRSAMNARLFIYATMVMAQVLGSVFGFGSVTVNQLFGVNTAYAAEGISHTINYQGKLMDADGNLVADGDYDIIFSLYDAASAGTRLWTANGTTGTPTAVTVSLQSGLFSVLLGDVSAGMNEFSAELFNNDSLYLGITVTGSGDSEMLPRKRLSAVPYAYNSEMLQGQYASNTVSNTGGDLFALHQGSNDSASATRTSLGIYTSGTSNTNDYLIRGNSGTDVFTVNRQGNTNIAGTLNASATSTFTDISLSGRVNSNLLPYITDTYSLGNSTYRWLGITAQNINAVNVSSTNIDALGYVSTTNLYVDGVQITGATPNLDQVTTEGNITSNAIGVAGVSSTGDILATSNTYNLGTSANRWGNAYLNGSLYATGTVQGGTMRSYGNLRVDGTTTLNTVEYTWPGSSSNGLLRNTGGTLSWDPATYLTAVAGTSLTSANLWVGNASNQAAAVAMSGDATISNTGAVTVVNDSHNHTGTTLSIPGTSLTNAKLWVGNGSGAAAEVTMSGDGTLSNAGVLDVSGLDTADFTSANISQWTNNVGYVTSGTAFVQNGNSFSATAVLGTNDANNLQFETADSVKMTILTSGNVGINDVNPAERLVVGGNIRLQAGGNIDTSAAGTLTIGGTTQTGLTMGRTGAATTLRGSNFTNGGLAYGASNQLTFTSAGTAGMAVLSGGAGAPTFGTLGLTYGGTNANLSGVATGGILYKGATAIAGTGALTGVLKGNGSGAPSAMTGTANRVTYWSDANTLGTSNLVLSGNNIYPNAAGSLGLTGNRFSDAYLSGSLYATGTVQGGTMRSYGNLRVDGTTTLNTVEYTWPGSSSNGLLRNTGGTLSWDPATYLTAVAGTSLTSANLWVGNASNQATAVTMSGDATISNTGAVTVVNDSHNHTGTTLSIPGTSLTSANLWVGNASNQAAAVAMSGDGSISNTGALTVNDNSHNHDGTTISGLTTADFTSANISQWTNNVGYLSSSTAFIDGGNLFGATGDLGTNDAFALNFRTNNATRVTIDTTGNLYPSTNLAYDLGSSSNRWKDIWASSTYIGSSTWNLRQNGSGYFTIADVGGSEKVTVDTNGRVGIGTSAPARELHIADGIIRVDRSSDSASFMLHRYDGVDPWKTFFFGVNATGTNDGYFFISDLGSAVTGGGTQRLVIDNIGNVGIGDSTPAALLTVGNGDLFQVTSAGYVRAPNGSVGSPSYSFVADPDTGIFGNGSNEILFSLGGVQKSWLNDSGLYLRKRTSNNTGGSLYLYDGADTNVVGLRAPTAAMGSSYTLIFPSALPGSSGFIKSDSSGNLSFDTATYLTSANAFVQGGNSFGATAVLGTNDPNNLQFETSGTPKMTILTTGEVGIGNETPDSKLFVQDGSLNGTSSTVATFWDDSNDGINGGVLISNFLPRLTFNDRSATGQFFDFRVDTNKLYFGTGDHADTYTRTADLMTILNTGNVGIGDTTPAALFTVGNGDKYQVNTAGNVTSYGTGNNTYNGFIRANSSIGLSRDNFADHWSNGYIATTLGFLGTNGSYGFDMVGNGYRNTSAGWTSLNQNGQTGGTIISLRPEGNMIFGTDATVTGITPTTRMIINSAGDVGIATSNPQGKLHVAGELVTSGVSDALRTVYGNFGVIHRVDSNNYYQLLTNSGDAYGTWNSFRPYALDLDTGDVALGNYTLYVEESGNVGVGDTSPLALFTVGNGDLFRVNSSGRVLANSGASGAGNLAYSFVADTDTGLYNSATNEIRLQTAAVDRVTFAANGNVGIGTTAPAGLFSVREHTIEPISRLDVADGVYILAPFGQGSDRNIMGSITFQRSSGLYGGGKVDVVYSAAGSNANYTANVSYSGTEYDTSWELVSFDYDGSTWVGLRRQGGEYWSTGVFFNGVNYYTGAHRFEFIPTASTTNIATLNYTASKNTYVSKVGIGDSTPASLLTVGDGDKFQVDTNGNVIKINNVTYSWPAANAAGVLRSDSGGTLSWDTTTYLTSANAFIQNGNSFGASAVLGTNDGNSLYFETNGSSRAYFDTGGTFFLLGTANTRRLRVRANASQTNSNPLLVLEDSAAAELARFHSDNSSTLFAGFEAGINNTVASGLSNSYFGSLAGRTNTTGDYITAIGSQSLYSNTGSQNTAVGYQTAYYNQTGILNTAIGVNALRGTANYTASNYNTAMGAYSLYSIQSTADHNTAVGHASQYNLTTGDNNVSLGKESLNSNQTGSWNTAIGNYALWSNLASNNLAMGYETAYYNQTGLYNIAIGNSAMKGTATYTDSDRNTAIGYESLTSISSGADDNTAMGYRSLFSITTGDLNVAIGSYAATGLTTGRGNTALGQATLGDTQSGNYNTAIGNNAMNSDGLGGNYNFNTAVGAGSMYGIDSGIYNTAVGYNSLNYPENANYNTAIGGEALYMTTGSSNTAVGYYSLRSNTSGQLNSALGTWALRDNSTGYANTAVGFGGLALNRFGYENTAVGYSAMIANVNGDYNTALGYEAVGYNDGNFNTGIGHSALLGTETSNFSYNTGIGVSALESLTTGASNTAVGFESLLNNTDGNYNVSVGSGALYNYPDDGATAVGFNALYNVGVSDVFNTALGYRAAYNSGLSAAEVKQNTAIGYESMFSNTSGSFNTVLGYRAAYGGSADSRVALGESALYTGGTSGAVAVGGGVGFDLQSTGYSFTGVGHMAGFNATTGDDLTFVGYQAGYSNTYAGQNTYIGTSAGYSGTSGGSNTAVGTESLYTNTSGRDNSAFGRHSLYDLNGGSFNTAMGYQSGYHVSSTSAEFNTAVGYQSLLGNATLGSTGAYNTALGSLTLLDNTSGNRNVAVGAVALTNNTTGAWNVAIGTDSLQRNTTGFSNVGIGFESSFYNLTGDYNTALGNNALKGTSGYSHSNNTAIGSSALASITNGYGNSALGSGALTNLSSANYNTAVGINAGNSITTGGSNTVIGNEAGYYVGAGTNNAVLGYQALKGTSGSNDYSNVAVGTFALGATNGASGNSGVGYYALDSLTSGAYNVGIGYYAGGGITTGSHNIAIGRYALDYANGSDHIAIGYNALGVVNTSGIENMAIGSGAGDTISSGSYNIMIGNAAGDLVSTGQMNTFIGWHAGNNGISTGNYNTMLGYGTDASSNWSNATAIGYYAVVNASNAMQFGNNAITAAYFGTSANGVTVTTWGSFADLSDSRLKSDISKNKLGLNFINLLEPIHYTMTSSSAREDGLIAQDVEAAALSIGEEFNGVVPPDESFEYYRLSYGSFVGPLINAVQELYASSSPLWNGIAIDANFATTSEPFMQVDTDGNIAYKGVSITAQGIATSSTQAFDSYTFSFKGSAWNSSTTQEITTSFDVFNNTISATSSEFKLVYTTGTGFTQDLLTISNSGDVHVSGDLHVGRRLYLGSKTTGEGSTSTYIFVDDTLNPTSTYIATNADGWQTETTYDYAERYESNQELVPGDLVTADPSGINLVKRATSPLEPILGIISTKPGFVTGRHYDGWHPVALAGRVPTRVSTMNGAIKAGDYIAASNIPGVGVKATGAGNVVGVALESYNSPEEGLISVFVKPSFSMGSISTSGASAGTIINNTNVVSSAPRVEIEGLALIKAGATEVHISYGTIQHYSMVYATPHASIEGAWWVGNRTDTGFDIILSQPQGHDTEFTWLSKPMNPGTIMFVSDNTYQGVDDLTGQVIGPSIDEIITTSTDLGTTTSTDSGTTTSTDPVVSDTEPATSSTTMVSSTDTQTDVTASSTWPVTGGDAAASTTQNGV